MVERVEIFDTSSLEKWLSQQSQKSGLSAANRSALRALPHVWEEPADSDRTLLLGSFRCLVISCARLEAQVHGQEIDEFNRASRALAEKLEVMDEAIVEGVHSRCFSAAQSIAIVSSADASNSEDTAFLSVRSIKHASQALFPKVLYSELEWEAGSETKINPLWREGKPFGRTGECYQGLKRELVENTDGHWSFWIEWYEAVLEGTWTNWDLIFAIATTLTEDDWDKGAAHVAGRIKEIRKEHSDEATSTGQTNPAEPSAAEKASVANRVYQNRDAIALSVAALLEHLADYREKVRGLNGLEPEYREDLLHFIDSLSEKLNELLALLPEQPVALEPEEGGKFIQWFREYRSLVPGIAKRYVEPQNIADATVPSGVILGCTGIGALVGGPVGAGVGGVVGKLITNEMKPGQAAKAVFEERPEPTESSQ